jgi:hypothetical protein
VSSGSITWNRRTSEDKRVPEMNSCAGYSGVLMTERGHLKRYGKAIEAVTLRLAEERAMTPS